MVNLYDSYQQSKVMNIIPDTASKLLKAKKEQMAVDAESDKLLDDITGKMNSPYASRLDAEEKAGIMKGYLDEVNGIMSNQELDGYGKFSGISAIKRKMSSNKRIYDLDASNKVMISEIAKIDPALREAFDATLLKDLKSPTDGTIWSGNFAMDFDKEMGNTLNRAYAGLPSEDFTLTYKDKSGKSISTMANGVSQERIDEYINNNADYLLNENPALKMKVIGSFIKQTGRAPLNDGSEKAMIDDLQLTGMFKTNLKAKLSEYANSRAIVKDKGFTVNNYIPKVNTETPPLEPLFNEVAPMYSAVSARMGLNGSYGDARFNQKLMDHFKMFKIGGSTPSYTFKTPTTQASSNAYAMSVWEDGATPVSTEYRTVINNYKKSKVDVERMQLSSSEAETGKEVLLIPKLQNSSLFAYGKNGSGQNITKDISTGSQLLNERISQELQMASDRGSIYTTRASLTPTYSIMSDGSSGSVANVTVSDRREKGSNKSSASDIFSLIKMSSADGGASAWDYLNSKKPGTLKLDIGNGLMLNIVKTSVKDKDESYNEYSFDVIKKGLSPNQSQFMQSVYNRETGKPGLSTVGAGYSNSTPFRR